MRRQFFPVVCGAALCILFSSSALAQEPSSGPQSGSQPPAVEELSDGRLKVGPILVDRQARRFTVPGKVIRLDPPLEYLAVAKQGDKAYESLLELDANAFEFNLACILVGLNAKASTRLEYHFDDKPVQGMSVKLFVAWDAEGKRMEVPADQLLTNGNKPVEHAVWVYTGSAFAGDQFMAAQMGTLIGVVHDPASIIEHREGLGLGNYGAVAGDGTVAPAVGTRIFLTLTAK